MSPNHGALGGLVGVRGSQFVLVAVLWFYFLTRWWPRLVLRWFVPVQAHSGSQFFLLSARPRALVPEMQPLLRTFSPSSPRCVEVAAH